VEDATKSFLEERYYWPNLQFEVAQWLNQNCIACKAAKLPMPKRAGLLQQVRYEGDGSTMGMDLFGPIDSHQGKKYLLVCYDPFSHFLILDVVNTKEDTSILDAFIRSVILQGHLPSKLILTDNGSEFKNQLFSTFLSQFTLRYGTKPDVIDDDQPLRHKFTIPYHPSSNFTERVNKFIKGVLTALLSEMGRHPRDWVEFTRYVSFAYNRQPIPGTNITPYMLRYGRNPRIPSDYWAIPQDHGMPVDRLTFLEDRVKTMKYYHDLVTAAHDKAKRDQKLRYDERQFDVEYEPGDKVLWYRMKVQNKLFCHWTGPFVIVKKLGPAAYVIAEPGDVSDRDKHRVASVQHLTKLADTASLNTPHLANVQFHFADSVFARQFEQGKFVIYRKCNSNKNWRNEFHVAQVFEPYDHFNGWISLHSYVHFGVNDDPELPYQLLPLAKRVLRPEYKDKEGRSFSMPSKVQPTSEPVLHDFAPGEIEVLQSGFLLKNNKIPANIAQAAYEAARGLDGKR